MRSAVIILAAAVLTLGGCPASSGVDNTPDPDTLLIFHNNTGPMCLDALDWLADVAETYPALTVEEHLTYESGEAALLLEYEEPYAGVSQGFSTSFQYLPIIFFQGEAFSGFDADVEQALEDLLVATTAP